MSSYKDSVTHSSASEHLLGRVKWFNNKAGYGFITVTDGTRSGTDIFVHHSAINVENQQYKYLVQGEYVEFDLIKVESDNHEWQASRVSGIRDGKLMCETRRDLKIARNEYKATKTTDVPVSSTESRMPRQKALDTNQPRQRKTTDVPVSSTEAKMPRQKALDTNEPRQRKTTTPRVRGEGPRDGHKKEWTLVGDKPKSSTRKPSAEVKTTNSSTIITIQSK
jgi:CspA family cold shock protein